MFVCRNTMNNTEIYGLMFAFRKTVEIAAKVPNSYLYSKLIARPWINHAKVGLVVANCWSSFIIHRQLKNSSTTCKVRCCRRKNSLRSVSFSAVIIDALHPTPECHCDTLIAALRLCNSRLPGQLSFCCTVIRHSPISFSKIALSSPFDGIRRW